jgi:hypothetical protein
MELCVGISEEGATEKQIAFLYKLVVEKDFTGEEYLWEDIYKVVSEGGTKTDASVLISVAIDLPDVSGYFKDHDDLSCGKD